MSATAKEILTPFNNGMALAILQLRKWHTRRPVRNPFGMSDAPDRFDAYEFDATPELGKVNNVFGFENESGQWKSPFGKPGDVIAVRESARVVFVGDVFQEVGEDGEVWDEYRMMDIIYNADDTPRSVVWPSRMKWIPISGHSIPNGCHKEAVRTKRKVKRVWVERVQDISDEDCRAEGVPTDEEFPMSPGYCVPAFCNGQGVMTAVAENLGVCDVDCYNCDTIKKRFRNLWESCGYSWESNQYVWCCEFGRIENE